MTRSPREAAPAGNNPPGETMAASKSSDDPTPSPEPRPARAPLARPAAPPARPPGERPITGSMPRVSRPFVHRDPATARRDRLAAEAQETAVPRPVAPAADVAPWPEPAETNAAAGAVEVTVPDANRPAPRVDEDVWPLVLAPEAGAPLVPGAGAPPRSPTPGSSQATRNAGAELDAAADVEWSAISELGDFETPATEAPRASVRTARSERQHVEVSPAVVPPAEAWPDDVWTNTPDADAGAADGETPHPVTLGNDVAPLAEDDATSGSLSAAPRSTTYPPGVPDTVDAYALDGVASDVGAPSAVYTPETAQAWVDGAGGIAAEAGMPVPLTTPAERTVASEATRSEMAVRLRQLADEVQSGALRVPDVAATMRDSEALVALLGVLLRAAR